MTGTEHTPGTLDTYRRAATARFKATRAERDGERLEDIRRAAWEAFAAKFARYHQATETARQGFMDRLLKSKTDGMFDASVIFPYVKKG